MLVFTNLTNVIGSIFIIKLYLELNKTDDRGKLSGSIACTGKQQPRFY